MFVVAFRITIREKDHEIKRTPGGTATGMTAKAGLKGTLLGCPRTEYRAVECRVSCLSLCTSLVSVVSGTGLGPLQRNPSSVERLG